jgi:hypothetical protein
MSHVGNSLYIIDSYNHNIFLKSDTLLPALPYISVRVLIGPDEDFSGFSLMDEEEEFSRGKVLAPNPTSFTTDKPVPTSWTPTVNYAQATYPNENVEYNGIRWLHGYKMVSFLLCPFRYNAASGDLFLKKSITLNLSIHQDSDPIKNSYNSQPFNDSRLATIKQIVVNKSDVESLYRPSAIGERMTSSKSSSPVYDYLIVTNQEQRAQYQRIADWKTRKGVRTKVITTEGIDSMYPSISPKSLRIKTAIRDYYQQGAKYALLGGDTCVVPDQQCYIHAIVGSDTLSKTTVTDLFYSCFQNMNWDTNGNGVWGEVEDNVQIIPEIALTRIPSETASDAQVFADRLLEFESNPVFDNWKNQILMSGKQLGLFYNDAESLGDSIYIKYIHPYWGGSQFKLYNSMTDYPQGASYDLSAGHLQTELAKGYPFVNMITHGESFCWQLESGSYYFDDHAAALNNSGYSIITTSACHTNDFDHSFYPYCLSEVFLKNPTSGILAYLGSSREGISSSLRLKYSEEYNGKFFRYLMLGNSYGEAVRLAKIDMEPLCSSYDAERYIHFALNPLGDPEMPVYLSTPKTFDGIVYSLYNDKLILDANADNCKICVMDPNGGNIYYHVESFDGYTEIDGVQPGYLVCVSKQDYIPWTATLTNTGSNIEYIQDETYTNNTTIVAKEVFVGSDVTTTMPNGAVVIQNGNVSIRGIDGVTIKNDFEVKSGASFEVRE